MQLIAEPKPGKPSFTVGLPSSCHYPSCKTPEFQPSESAVDAILKDELGRVIASGAMHVRHTTLHPFYDGGVTEFADSDDRWAAAEPTSSQPLAIIPPQFREAPFTPEERLVPASELINIAKEMSDKGAFTVLPFAHGRSTQCKVLIMRDPA